MWFWKVKGSVSITAIFALIVALAITAPSSANAATAKPPTLDEYLMQRLSTNELSQDERESIEKVLEQRKITEAQVLDSLRAIGTVPSIAQTNVQIGLDTVFYAATEGLDGGSTTGVGNRTTSYDLSNNRNLVGNWTVGAGTATGWAWTGYRFNVTGAGSQVASFSVDGFYGALLHAVGQAANATMSLNLRLYDATTANWVDAGTVAYEFEADNTQSYYRNYNDSNVIQATLHAGHQYVILLMFEGTAVSLGAYIAEVESGNPNLSLYSEWGSIELNW